MKTLNLIETENIKRIISYTDENKTCSNCVSSNKRFNSEENQYLIYCVVLHEITFRVSEKGSCELFKPKVVQKEQKELPAFCGERP